MKTLLFVAVAASALLGAQAIAENAASPSTTVEKNADVAPKPAGTAPSVTVAPGSINYYSKTDGAWRATKLIGSKVVNSAGETVGDINEIVLDGSGKATAAVIGVGGFLGLGEHEVAVNFDSLKVTRDANGKAKVTLDVTKDSLKAAPQWKWAT